MRLLLLFLALAAAAPAAAQTFPELTGRVVDTAELLRPDEEQALAGRLEALEQAAGRQLVVVTVPSLEGYPIEDYGYRLGRHWGIGQSDANNGALLIVAPSERRVRIEVGYGLEGIMTDALASGIVNNDILPRFRANDYSGGIMAGADAIIAQFQAPSEEAEARIAAARAAEAADRDRGDGSMLPIFIWIGVVGLVLFALASRAAKGRSYRSTGDGLGWIILWEILEEVSRNSDSSSDSSWSSGGSSWGGSSWGGGGGGWSGGSSGGFSGGGGSFGGGGASGGW